MKIRTCGTYSIILSSILSSIFFSTLGNGQVNSINQTPISDTKSNEEIENADMNPFIRSNNKIIDDDVVGLRITENKLYMLGRDKNFYVEPLDNKFNFDDIDFFSKYQNLQSVDLHKLVLTREILENLQKYLPKTLKNLVINKCKISKKDYDDIVEVLQINEELTAITLIEPDVELAESTRLIGALFQLKNLQAINITLGAVGKQGIEELSKILQASSNSLKSLTIGFSSVQESEEYNKFLDILKELTQLVEFEFSVLESTPEQTTIFFNSLKNMKNLRKLKFYFHDFEKHDHVKAYHNAIIFRDAIIPMPLEFLDISYMKLHDSVLQMFAQALPKLTHLKSLNISGNPLSDKSAKELSESIKNSTELITLIANDCKMDENIFASLCSSLNNCGLQYLYFRENNIGQGIKSLPIDQMKYIQVVDFSNNNINYDNALDFASRSKDNPLLQIVNFANNKPIMDLNSVERSAKNDLLVKLKMSSFENKSNHTLFLGL